MFADVLTPIIHELFQCVINVPSSYCDPISASTERVSTDEYGNIRMLGMGGTTLIFDSFSPESDVERRNVMLNTISRVNDARRHFQTEISLNISTKVVAVLNASTVHRYRQVERRHGVDGDSNTLPLGGGGMSAGAALQQVAAKQFEALGAVSSPFDHEIAEMRRRCDALINEMPFSSSDSSAEISIGASRKRAMSIAEALSAVDCESRKRCNPPAEQRAAGRSFLSVLCHAPPTTPQMERLVATRFSSGELLVTCTTSLRNVMDESERDDDGKDEGSRSNERIAVSALHAMSGT